MKRLLLIAFLFASGCATTYTCIPNHPKEYDLKGAIYDLATANGILPDSIQYCVIDTEDIYAVVYGRLIKTSAFFLDSLTEEFLYCTVAHELAHIILGHMPEDESPKIELEADLLAIKVLEKYGMDGAKEKYKKMLWWLHVYHLDKYIKETATHPSLYTRLANLKKSLPQTP